MAACNVARENLSRGIGETKRLCARNLNYHLTCEDRSHAMFLGVQLTDHMSFSISNAVDIRKDIRETRRCLEAGRGRVPRSPLHFCRGTIESILTHSFTSWFESSQLNRRCPKSLPERDAEAALHPQIHLHHAGPRHPSHGLFSLLPSRRRSRSVCSDSLQTLNILTEIPRKSVKLLSASSPSAQLTAASFNLHGSLFRPVNRQPQPVIIRRSQWRRLALKGNLGNGYHVPDVRFKHVFSWCTVGLDRAKKVKTSGWPQRAACHRSGSGKWMCFIFAAHNVYRGTRWNPQRAHSAVLKLSIVIFPRHVYQRPESRGS